MKPTHITHRPGRDWHSHTRARMQELERMEHERNEPNVTGVLHFDADGRRIPSTPYTPAAVTGRFQFGVEVARLNKKHCGVSAS